MIFIKNFPISHLKDIFIISGSKSIMHRFTVPKDNQKEQSKIWEINRVEFEDLSFEYTIYTKNRINNLDKVYFVPISIFFKNITKNTIFSR